MDQNPLALDRTTTEERLSDFLAPMLRYLLVLAVLLALGLAGVYVFARTGLIGVASWQLLAGAATAGVVGLAQFPILGLTQRRRGYAAFWAFALVLALWSIVVTLLSEGVWPAAILIAWIPPLAAVAATLRRDYIAGAAALSTTCTAGVLWITARPPIVRIPAGNAATTAAVILLSSTVLLFVLGTIVVRLIRYRSLQSRLVVSFVLIITVPILVTTAVSAITAFSNSQEQFADALQAISSLKQAQIDVLVQNLAIEMGRLQQGSTSAASVLHVLDRADQSEADFRLNLSLASTLIRDVIVQNPASHYEEILVLDPSGKVLLSTYKLDEGTDFSNQSFFTRGSVAFSAQMARFPSKQNPAGEYKLVAAAPVYGANTKEIRGVVVSVAKSDIIFNILGPTTGLANARTYLVNSDYSLLTDSAESQPAVTAGPIVHLILSKAQVGSNTYLNHEGQSVLGYAAWDPYLNAAVVAEIPRSAVLNKSLTTLFLSTLVGLFSIVIAVIAGLAISRAISDPIGKLAVAADSFSKGNLTARATAEQGDEVGALAHAFNSMADQLQGMIGNLEQRIAERTQALEQQSLRLRTAAEVARDAAYAPNLDELLEQAARLIRDRFNLYHTGIFLIDEKKEFAVLRASPSDAGKQMLANDHRLRVGEQGIVGRVAATGEPRIALDTGVDPIYFSNPLLPQTHSEMALPLKTADGTIGVIDIQSDQPEAFTQDDIAIVQVMADQLATAIQRTRLLQQVRSQLDQLEHTNRGFTEQSWRVFEESGRPTLGYKFDNVRLESIKTPAEASKFMLGCNGAASGANGKDPGHQTVEVPIRLRGQLIGVVSLRFQSTRAPEATLSMVQQIADRLATSLENSRLLEDSVRQANKERAISEITAKISASVNMRNVLQTAVEELGRAMPGSDVLVQFRPDTEI